MDPSVSLAVQLKDLGEAIVIALGSEGSPGVRGQPWRNGSWPLAMVLGAWPSPEVPLLAL